MWYSYYVFTGIWHAPNPIGWFPIDPKSDILFLLHLLRVLRVLTRQGTNKRALPLFVSCKIQHNFCLWEASLSPPIDSGCGQTSSGPFLPCHHFLSLSPFGRPSMTTLPSPSSPPNTQPALHVIIDDVGDKQAKHIWSHALQWFNGWWNIFAFCGDACSSYVAWSSSQ